MKLKILALAAEPPRMPGSGGEVRTYYFMKMLAEVGDLTLVSLGGPTGESEVVEDIAGLCHDVIEPGISWRKTSTSRTTRIQAWLRIIGVFAFPWRNNWKEFYLYCLQYLQDGLPAALAKGIREESAVADDESESSFCHGDASCPGFC